MSRLSLIAAIAIGAGFAPAQSAPPICFAFNDFGMGTPWGTANGSVAMECTLGALTSTFVAHFVAPVSSSVDGIQMWRAPNQSSVTAISLYATASLGAALPGSSLGEYAGTLVDGWDFCWKTTAPPVAVTAGSTYAVRIRLLPGGPQSWWFCPQPGFCYSFGYDAGGATPLLYQYNPGACAPSVPATGQLPVSIRFRGLSCAPGPLASLYYLSLPCGGSLPFASDLSFAAPPVLALPFLVAVVGSPGETAWVFWSAGVNTTGWTSIVPGSSCSSQLDLPSFASFAAMGAEPLLTGVLQPTTQGIGIAYWILAMPASPGLAGSVIGVQALVTGPSGTIPIGPGVLGQVTSTVQLTLGY